MNVYVRKSLVAIIASVLVLTPTFMPTAFATPTIDEYPLTGDAAPHNITTGPDGALWFTEYDSGKIGRIATDGTITEYSVGGNELNGITTGPDGALWFANSVANKIGRITTSGVVTQYTVPRAYYWPEDITTGPDGALWFTGEDTGFVGRITTSGSFSFFGLTGGYIPRVITTGPDGALWLGEYGASDQNSVGRLTTSGDVTEYALSNSSGNYNRTYGITTGSDGNIWLTELDNGKIARVTTQGVVTEYAIPTSNSQPWGIASGVDGALWFTESGSNKIGRITTDGVVTEYAIPTSDSHSWGITSGPDGGIWFGELYGNKIGHLALAPSAPTGLAATTPTNQAPHLTWNAVGGATSYHVYRDGTQVGTTTNGAYVDTTASEGTHSYYATAVNGAIESDPSASISVVLDRTRPTIAFAAPADFSTPFMVGPAVTVAASDASGLQTLAIHVYTVTNQLLTTCGSATPAELMAGSMSCDLSGLSSGTYYIRAGAFDNAHNNMTISSGNFVVGN